MITKKLTKSEIITEMEGRSGDRGRANAAPPVSADTLGSAGKINQQEKHQGEEDKRQRHDPNDQERPALVLR